MKIYEHNSYKQIFKPTRMISCDTITSLRAVLTDLSKTCHATRDTRYCTIMFPQCI